MSGSRTELGGEAPLYPQACGWCGGLVLSAEGWIIHGWAMCRILQDIADPPCIVTVKPDVYEWLSR